MRWTGLVLSLAILGLTISLLFATSATSSGQLTVRSAPDMQETALAKPVMS
ncbi:hypothetical protein [Maricaulis sp.]|uniref:hypothetical protein n=1 Tax=Maricaulis sp. TaxID=1486257 RepID=UPI001B17550A|nr:hypothetical protein [Maricaulis sp.]MBO6765056.1 hypothetical protein [Maricaulis sp.]